MIGQGATQTSPSPGLHPSARASGDVNITALACAPYDSILSAPLPTSSNPSDHRRPTAAKAPHPNEVLKCPRCDSLETKFCYYNNYSLTQPRYFCKNCKRYWTAGGALRNVPVGGGLRKNKRSKLKLAAAAAADAEAAALAAQTLAGGGQPQSQGKATGEVPNKVDNRATVAHGNNAMPAHLVVGVPELGVYVQSGGMSTSKRHVVEDPPHYSVEHTADRNDTHMASAPTLPQQAASLYVKDEGNATAAGPATFFCDPAQVPQFYSSYAASLPIQYGNAAVPGGAVPGYAVNYNFFTPDPNGNSSNEECGNASANVSVAGPVTAKQEKDATDGSGNAYDWQLISEGLFNGSGANDGNFFYAPSASWPDFSQFNDNGPR